VAEKFEMALSDKRKYPVRQFCAFWEAGRRYAELTKRDPLIHRSVVSAVNGLTDFVTAERRRVPEQVVRDAERLESRTDSLSRPALYKAGPGPDLMSTKRPLREVERDPDPANT
jgi:hypothetical protein